jgi:hypothetical protein
MRTTLDIAEDVLFAAKEVARRDRRTVGDVVSHWARQALLAKREIREPGEAAPSDLAATAVLAECPLARYGIHPLPARGVIVTDELVNRLRDEEGI